MAKQIRLSQDLAAPLATLQLAIDSFVLVPNEDTSRALRFAMVDYQADHVDACQAYAGRLADRDMRDQADKADAQAAKTENKARKRLAKLDAMRAELAAQIAPRKVEVG